MVLKWGAKTFFGLAAFVLFCAVFLTYSNVYHFDFLYDDEFFIVKNEHLKSFSSLPDIFTTSSTAGSGFKDSFYRPVQFALYLVVQQVFGTEPWGFHLLNLTLHFLNAVLFLRMALLLRLSPLISLLVALLWCVHPIHTECVAYKSATADSLHTFFLLSGLVVMLPLLTRRRMILGWVLFALAILSKENAVLGAPLFTAGVFYFSEQRWKLQTYFKTLPFWLMSLGYSLMRKTILNFDGDFSFYKESNVYTENIVYRLYTFFATLPEYLRLLVWPQDLHIDRAFPVYAEFATPLVILGFVMCCGAGAIVAWYSRTRERQWLLPTFLILWFASLHLLHSGVLLPLNSLFLEHWMYMPSMAFFLFIGMVLTFVKLRSAKLYRGLLVLMFVIIGFSAHATHVQNRVWSSSISLFSHILRLNPEVARARHGLAMAYSDLGEDTKALELYEEALRQREYPQTYHNMALIYLKKGQLEKGEEFLLKALHRDPQFFPSYPYLINLYYQLGKQELAENYKQKFLQLKAN